MEWSKLLAAKRPGDKSTPEDAPHRSRFEQDYDRIIFSSPFRKLQDKTQVFPLPEDDFVHTRLTHSLEVSSVGRSLGKSVGAHLAEKYPDLQINPQDIGAIVGAGALAHDIGNPPFGHSGEESISNFFRSSVAANDIKQRLTAEEINDLSQFEGNAQGFRLLNDPNNKGLRVTYATLGAFTKYPLSSSGEKIEERKSQKKYGFYQSDAQLFEDMATEMGLTRLNATSWVRHPLTFLVEAADDICYHIIDLEDGCRLGLIPFEQFKEFLAAIIGASYSPKKLDQIPTRNEKLGTLRALAIGRLIAECTDVFIKNEAAILNGSFDKDLTSIVPSHKVLDDIIGVSIRDIYRSKLVLEKEAGGFSILETLISDFSLAAFNCVHAAASAHDKTLFRLIPEEYGAYLTPDNSVYQSMQIVVDFVSGLTDSHAVRLYKTITGNRF